MMVWFTLVTSVTSVTFVINSLVTSVTSVTLVINSLVINSLVTFNYHSNLQRILVEVMIGCKSEEE